MPSTPYRALFATALVLLAGLADAAERVPQPVTINASNAQNYQSVLPTGRKISPVGEIVATPNFPTMLAAHGHQIAVLANGATPFQTITWYDAHSLARVARLAAFSKAVPPVPITVATPGGSGLAIDVQHAGAAGVVYIPAQSAAFKKGQAERTLAAEKNPVAIPTTPLGHRDLFQGLVAAQDGTFYATGGASDQVMAFRLQQGKVQVLRQYPLHWQPFPKTQYPYQYQGDHQKTPLFYPDSVVLGPGQKHLYVTGMLANSLARIDLRTGQTDYLNVGAYPFAVALADDGQRLVVSDWGANQVAIIDRQHFHLLGYVATGPELSGSSTAAGNHPTALVAMPHSPLVYVADANSDHIVGIDTQSLRPVQVIHDTPYPSAPPGSYPDGLAYADGRLFIANAGNNAVAVFDQHSGKALGLMSYARIWCTDDLRLT